jgi:autotransporter-associated beta strand protein
MMPTTSTIQRNSFHSNRRCGRHRNRALAAAFVAALAPAAIPLAQAAQLTWSGGGSDTNWSTAANWAGAAPASNDSLIFAGNTNLITNNDITGFTALVGTAPASAIAFINASNVTGGAFTLGGNSITLGGPINTTALTTGTLVDTISLQIDVSATRTITTATNHGLTISGLVNDTSGANSGGITKTGVATLLLSNDLNNFTSLTIQQGTLSATSIEPSGLVSAIGRGNTITMGNTSVEGILTFTGTNAPTGDINRSIALANSTIGGRINNNSTTVPLVFDGTFSASGTSSRVMTLGGTNTGANEFKNTLVNPASPGILTLAKVDGGAWRLSGANTYTGQTNINNGTLSVAIIADSGSSNLGVGTLIRIGNTSTTGILNYTGSGSTTSRTVQIGNNSATPATGDTGGATINNNGTGALIFAGASFNATGLTGSVATSRTLTLGGANTGANEIQGVIANGLSGTMVTNLAKSGNGTWLVSGANTFTGTTTINAGTLKLGGSTVLPNTNSLTIGATGAATTSTLDLNGFPETIGSLSLGRTTTTVAGAMANVVNNGGGLPILTLGGALTYNAGSGGFENGQATISANVDTGGAGRNIIVGDGGATVDLLISGAISGVGNLTKQGAGTLQLSGANTNTGNLVIQDGAVKLGASNVLVDTTSINVGNNSSAAGATFDLNGFSDTISTVTLGATAPTSAGLTHSIVDSVGGAVLQLGGSLTYNAGAVGFNNGTATLSAALELNGTTRNFMINDSDQTEQDFIVSGAIQNSTGTAGISKNNGGTLVLSGANTYNGNTNVIAGTLELVDNATMKFVLGAVSGASNNVNGSGNAILNGDFVIDTSAADALSSGSWTLENVTSLTGAYGPTFTVSGFSDIGGDRWEKDLGGGRKYTFDETTGILTLVTTSGSPYNAWAAANGLTGLPGSATDPSKGADPDKDGRNNLAEFAFNGDPLSAWNSGQVFGLAADSDFDGNTDKELILTVAVRTGTPVFTGSPSPVSENQTDGITYRIEGGTNLSGFPTTVNMVPTAVTNGLPAAGAGYEYRSFSLNGSNGLSGKGFLRAKVTSP